MEADLIRKEVEQAEQWEAAAMLRADISSLDSLWDDDLLAYSSVNVYAGKVTLLNLIKTGGLRLRTHLRQTLQVVVEGHVAMAIGSETSEFEMRAGEPITCSYLNVWARRFDGWKLIARHVAQRTRVPRTTEV